MKKIIMKLVLSAGLISVAAPLFASPVYTLRLFNVDDQLTAFITNSSFTNTQFLQANFNVDTGFFDLSSFVRAGANAINLNLLNDHGGWTYGYDFRKDGVTVESDVCGVVTLTGCNGSDTTVGPSVFTHQINFSPDVVTGETPEPASILLSGIGFLALGALLKRRPRSVA